MPFPASRLRLAFAVAGAAAALLVAGVYFYARHRVQNVLRQVPEKIGLGIQQSAQGFTFSKSEQGRTVLKLQAREVVQFKQGGLAELRDVTITLYGRDSSRFDQIYGSDFQYDPQSGDVTAKGEVQIDLEANPAGLTSSDQSTPKEMKNPIHLKTSGLIFNQKTQDAHTDQKVEFSIPQATGSAQGVSYSAQTRALTLESQINLVFTEPAPAAVTASRGTITEEPRTVILQDARLHRSPDSMDADQVTIALRADNNVDRILGTGNVRLHSEGARAGNVRAARAELVLSDRRGELQTASFSGHVEVEGPDPRAMRANAGRVTLHFARKNVVTAVRAGENVYLLQHQKPATPSATAQDLQLTAPAVDFLLAGGRRLDRAVTSAGAQISLKSADPSAGETHVTAGKFDVRFDALGQLASLHGAPDARIVFSIPGKPDRVSTSNVLDVAFSQGVGIQAVVQQGNVVYADGERTARADSARYTPADQVVKFMGSPRVVQGGMTATAQAMRIDRLTGDAFADGDVKTTYTDLKPQSGALLSSSSPIHVTAKSMTVHAGAATAIYTGSVRLWQDANVVSAPKIEFDRDHRSLVATDSANQKVSTTLVQVEKSGRTTPVMVTSSRLSYTDNARRARFEGGVLARATDFTVAAAQMDVLLRARDQPSGNQAFAGSAQLDRITAQGQVRIHQTTRHAEGDRLVYTAAEDKFVLSGGPPCIFDAEHGKITGVSLTLFRADDRVLVEGSDTSPSVTQTRVAR
jgi:lipopolysaccharide export system protein LptA